MPELAEVEIVRQGLLKNLSLKSDSDLQNNHQANIDLKNTSQSFLQEVKLFRPDLRFRIPGKSLKKLIGEKLLTINRKGKYLIFEFENHVILSHLGMTGNWRVQQQPDLKNHDHLFLKIANRYFIYNDPRRFGYVDVCLADSLGQNRFYKILGPDPLLQQNIDSEVFQKISNKQSPIRNVLLDQSVLCGVGNIYASEALFRAQINPLKPAARLKMSHVSLLLKHIREILAESILAGGSSIDDFHSVDGIKGDFQNRHQVYDRKGQNCVLCNTKIKHKILTGRSVYWCPKCQN
jgi:formamidopyrimidine-DNA glycosylase